MGQHFTKTKPEHNQSGEDPDLVHVYQSAIPSHQVKQYMYEANNVEYLDCCNSSAHVGHCHPQVKILLVLSKQKKLSRFFKITFIGGGQRPTADGEVDHSTGVHIREPEEICQGDTSLKHPMVNFVPQSLVTSLPESLSVCFFTTSGPEANDLAMRLVKRYTGESDIMVVEEAHHGNIGIMLDISPKMHPK